MKTLTRREFQRRAGVALALSPVLGGIACGPGGSSRSAGTTTPKTAATGALQMTLGPADVAVPPSEPAGEIWRYGIGLIVQVAPEKAAVLCNIKGKRGRDFEAGNDAFVFGDLSEVQASEAIPIARNHDEDNPNSSPAGQPAIMVKYPIRGGFVPLGAKLEDGSPHPHAGTGFGFSQAIAWTADQKSTYPTGQSYHYGEVYQLAYDGTSFLVTETQRIPYDRLLEGALISNPGMTIAIPDGEDLLFAMGGGIQDGFGAGLTRWSRQKGSWRPTSWVPITGPDGSFEASVIRDLDGSLLFSARAGRDQQGRRRLESRVWRSQDGGQSWTKTLHVVGAVGGMSHHPQPGRRRHSLHRRQSQRGDPASAG